VSIGKAVGEIQESVAEGDRKTQLLMARIGLEPKSLEEDGGSLWEAIVLSRRPWQKDRRRSE
jgi:hypothetical protein